jgi:hypothetical protein
MNVVAKSTPTFSDESARPLRPLVDIAAKPASANCKGRNMNSKVIGPGICKIDPKVNAIKAGRVEASIIFAMCDEERTFQGAAFVGLGKSSRVVIS